VALFSVMVLELDDLLIVNVLNVVAPVICVFVLPLSAMATALASKVPLLNQLPCTTWVYTY
jgi:hypothetical protein